MAGRSIWSGSISFGIVNIPVKLVAASQDKRLHFHQVSATKKVRARQRLVAEGSEDALPKEDIVKAYEIAPEQYVTVAPEELKALAAEKSRSIDIIDFVNLDEIDPLFFDKPYYVVPDERAGRAYWLLTEAMRSAGRVGIARFVMRDKETLAAIRPLEHGLCLETMRYHDEVIPLAQAIGHVKPVKPQERELKVASQIIDSLTTHFDADKYDDEYRKRVLEFLHHKAEGKTETIAEQPVEREGKVLDLMAALEASLGQVKNRAKDGANAGKPGQGGGGRSHAHPARKHPRKVS